MLDKKAFSYILGSGGRLFGVARAGKFGLESRQNGEGKHVLIRLRNKTCLFKMRKRKIMKHLEKENYRLTGVPNEHFSQN